MDTGYGHFLIMEGSYIKEKGCKIKIINVPPYKKGSPQSQAPPRILEGDGWLTWAGWPAPEGVESPWRWEQRELRRHTGSTVQPPTCVCEARGHPIRGSGQEPLGWDSMRWMLPGQALAQRRGPES